MEVTGKIYKVGAVQMMGANGFKKREVVINTGGEHPQYLPLEITNDKADSFEGRVGQVMTGTIDLKGRLWTTPEGTERCFCSIQCWKWEIQGNQEPAEVASAPAPSGDDSDSLPF